MINLHRKLQKIDINQLLTHEKLEQQRLVSTYKNIKEEKVIHHPILVVKVLDHSYMIIDGVHRYYSLRKLGYKNIPCQIVGSDEYKIDSWSHLIEKGVWFDNLCQQSVFKFDHENKAIKSKFIKLTCGDSFATRVAFLEGKDVVDECNLMHEISKTYQEQSFFRVGEKKESYMREGFALVSYPKFTMNEIIEYSKNNLLLPAGVTRFLVQGRLLNLNIPLQVLNEEECEWEKLIERREGKLRFYSEPVFVCDTGSKF
ncbi:ParB N-terminal domain-containing protein [Bacillus thuringiensis]|uniref:ParB N-terminal domain-containing protein n=1 Tax=Bacillus tropicus TaxID=2026188 RepID=UPI0035D6724C